MFHNVVRSRELVFQLFRRDFLAVYKKSFLGIFWILLLPVLGIVPVIFMKAANILQPGVSGVPYAVFALFSMTLWQMFAGVVGLSSQALSSASSLILQVKFAHETLLIKQCAQQLAISLLALAVSILVFLVSGFIPRWEIVFLPLMILPILSLGAGIGFFLAVISVVITDLERALAYVLQLLLYLTPVVYTADVEQPLLRLVIDWNPLTYLIGDVRDVVLFGSIRHPDRYAWACAFAFAVFLFGWRMFFLSEEHVIERLS